MLALLIQSDPSAIGATISCLQERMSASRKLVSTGALNRQIPEYSLVFGQELESAITKFFFNLFVCSKSDPSAFNTPVTVMDRLVGNPNFVTAITNRQKLCPSVGVRLKQSQANASKPLFNFMLKQFHISSAVAALMFRLLEIAQPYFRRVPFGAFNRKKVVETLVFSDHAKSVLSQQVSNLLVGVGLSSASPSSIYHVLVTLAQWPAPRCSTTVGAF